MELLNLSLEQILEKLNKKEVTSVEVTKAALAQIKKTAGLNALITVCEESALKQAAEIDKARAAGKLTGALGGVPVVLKDNIMLEGEKMTCASKALSNFVSPFSGTAVQKLVDAGAVVVGKANMDEFAIGGRSETSFFGAVKNPVDTMRVAGGSSGGSAASVAALQCFAALGTDTNGSLRKPAAYCGVVGLKPTYGLVSRFGIMALASSFDCVGPVTRTVKDSAIMLDVLAGKDDKDMTSVNLNKTDYANNLKADVAGLTIGVIKEFEKDLSPEAKTALDKASEALKAGGAIIKETSVPSINASYGAYQVICAAEASSNLARIDGIRYGYRAKDYADVYDLYVKSRTQGFGKAVKECIILGSFVLSSENFEKYFRKAKKVQKVIAQELENVYRECDLILSPVNFSVPPILGEKHDGCEPQKIRYTVFANLAGLPAISVPCYKTAEGLPIGIQLVANKFNEKLLLNAALFVESAKEEK